MINFNRKSWVEGSEKTQFPIQNLPFGIYSTRSKTKRIGVAIGDNILDLQVLVETKKINLPLSVVSNSFLND
jgi:fumarylacetoacetase